MSVTWIADQKIAVSQNYRGIFLTVHRKKIIFLYKFFYFHILNEIQINLFFPAEHNMYIQILSMRFPKTLLRIGRRILYDIDKQSFSVDRVASFLERKQIMGLSISKTLLNSFFQKRKFL